VKVETEEPGGCWFQRMLMDGESVSRNSLGDGWKSRGSRFNGDVCILQQRGDANRIGGEQAAQQRGFETAIDLTAIDGRTDVEPAAYFALCERVYILREIVECLFC
jgi:hypothetical protein